MISAAWRDLTRKTTNSAPVLKPQQFNVTLTSSSAVSGPLAFGGTDPDGDSLTYTVAATGTATGPKYGTVMINNATGTFTYDPKDSLTNGTITDSFTVTVTDGVSRSTKLTSSPGTTAVFTVVVAPVNESPKATDDFFSVIADSPVIANVLANDSDKEGKKLTAVMVSSASHGSVVMHADGSFTYTPVIGFTGTDHFAYVASDGNSTSMVANVNLMVAAIPAGKTPSIGAQGITWWSGLSDADTDRALDMAKAAGITSMRIDISWYVVEYNQGTFDYGLIDSVVNKIAARNISMLGMLYDTPAWLSGGTDPHAAPTTAAGREMFAQFAAATATHYLGQIDMWEIWNEPNVSRFWATPDAAAYAALLQKVYPAIKAVSSTATVVTGGLSPDSSGIAPVAFVQGLYAAGAGGYFDAIGLHPYTFPQLPSITTIEAVHNVMAANGDGAKQIWLTEVGAPTGTSPWAVSEDDQAQATKTFIDFARNNSYIGPVYLYSLLDTGSNLANPEDNFGLIRQDFTPKKAFGIWL